MKHPLYDAAVARLTVYEQQIAKAMEQRQPNWWQKAIHPQTMLDYLDACDDAHRISPMVTMMRDAINQAFVFYGAVLAVTEEH